MRAHGPLTRVGPNECSPGRTPSPDGEPFTYTIQLKENAQPVMYAARRVPAPLKDRLKEELNRMTTLGMIRKVEQPADWVNSMVCVKNCDLRI